MINTLILAPCSARPQRGGWVHTIRAVFTAVLKSPRHRAAQARHGLEHPTSNSFYRTLGFRAGNVLCGTRIDLDHFTLVDKQRHSNDSTGLELGRLLPTGRRVTAYP